MFGQRTPLRCCFSKDHTRGSVAFVGVRLDNIRSARNLSRKRDSTDDLLDGMMDFMFVSMFMFLEGYSLHNTNVCDQTHEDGEFGISRFFWGSGVPPSLCRFIAKWHVYTVISTGIGIIWRKQQVNGIDGVESNEGDTGTIPE